MVHTIVYQVSTHGCLNYFSPQGHLPRIHIHLYGRVASRNLIHGGYYSILYMQSIRSHILCFSNMDTVLEVIVHMAHVRLPLAQCLHHLLSSLDSHASYSITQSLTVGS